MPEPLFRPLRAAGTAVAAAAMPAQRRHSRDYLTLVLGRRAGATDIYRHFFAFEEALMAKLRLANGRDLPCDYDPSASAFREWLDRGGPVLLGTFHVGVSDMLGFQLGTRERRRVHILRRRVANSHDTERLAEIGGGCVRFVWGDDPFEWIAALREAAASGDAIALQCDRIENAVHTRAFDFLGARRLFPVTIYRLADLFRRPVILTVGVPAGGGRSRLYGSPLFEPAEGEARAASLERGCEHFQEFLRLVERLLRERPHLWFNFLPMNPLAAGEPGGR